MAHFRILEFPLIESSTGISYPVFTGVSCDSMGSGGRLIGMFFLVNFNGTHGDFNSTEWNSNGIWLRFHVYKPPAKEAQKHFQDGSSMMLSTYFVPVFHFFRPLFVGLWSMWFSKKGMGSMVFLSWFLSIIVPWGFHEDAIGIYPLVRNRIAVETKCFVDRKIDMT